jgi:hypothetical protein
VGRLQVKEVAVDGASVGQCEIHHLYIVFGEATRLGRMLTAPWTLTARTNATPRNASKARLVMWWSSW